MAKAKWLGPLGKRIEPNRWPVLDPIWKVDLRAIEEDRIFRERIEKLPLLLDHFKIARVAHAEQISGGDLLKLALALGVCPCSRFCRCRREFPSPNATVRSQSFHRGHRNECK